MLRLLPLGFLALVAFCGATSVHARPDDDSHWQKAYPAAEKGMKRIVIHLDAQKDEYSWKVELIVGKTVETDGVNRVALMGKLEERPVEGWGYTFYRADIKPGMISTLIGVDPNKPKVQQFVTLMPYGPVRYNSRLPIVVYIPEGYEVRYRFWKAEETTRTGEEG
jgi:ecotin